MVDEKPVILLVEPDESLGRVVASYLRRDGYRVVRRDRLDAERFAQHEARSAQHTADSGEATCHSPAACSATPPRGRKTVSLETGGDPCAARSERSEARPDLLLLDLDSLEPDERERQLATLTSVPLMLLTSDRAPSAWGRQIERFSVLYKPFTIHELRRRVNDLLTAGGVQG
jgi:DNA-binding response OmpR family regulator